MSMEVQRFDTWRQRVAMSTLTEPGFLMSPEGAAFLEQLDVFFAPGICGMAKRMGYPMEPGDVQNSIITHLLSNDGEVAKYASVADEPWAYLGRCAIEWARREWGHRGTRLEVAEYLPVASPTSDESNYTALDEVVALTYEVLVPRTPEHLHGDLLELLGWLAANPIQRLSYEAEERMAAHRFCPRMTIDQVTAVMNIAWGGRPRQKETSLMGAFLLDSTFRPSGSPSHARALTTYKNAIRAGAHSSRMLMDWIAS